MPTLCIGPTKTFGRLSSTWLECLGWDRVMFGSDWPVCTLSAPLKKWLETLSALTQDASYEQRHKLFHDNAQRIYRLE